VYPNTFLTLALAVRGKAPLPISKTTGLFQKPVWALGRKEDIFFAPEMEPRFVGPGANLGLGRLGSCLGR